jgi:hypothetical protein
MTGVDWSLDGVNWTAFQNPVTVYATGECTASPCD